MKLGGITRAGDETLRPSAWLMELLQRKPPKLAAVALANKTARVAWKLMISGESYKFPPVEQQVSKAA